MGFSGMFWFDNQNQKSIIEKVCGAIEGHQKRFGGPPQLCLMNETQFSELKMNAVQGVPIRVYKACLPDVFLVGSDYFQQVKETTVLQWQ